MPAIKLISWSTAGKILIYMELQVQWEKTDLQGNSLSCLPALCSSYMAPLKQEPSSRHELLEQTLTRYSNRTPWRMLVVGAEQHCNKPPMRPMNKNLHQWNPRSATGSLCTHSPAGGASGQRTGQKEDLAEQKACSIRWLMDKRHLLLENKTSFSSPSSFYGGLPLPPS